MKKVITYGTFDVLHQGHVNLLKRAKALGDWLIVGVTTDNFDLERGKMNTRDSVMKRVQAVKDTGYADEVIIEEYKGQKIDDILKYAQKSMIRSESATANGAGFRRASAAGRHWTIS